MMAEMDRLEARQAGVSGEVGALQAALGHLEGQQITGDYFHTNEAELVLAPDAYHLLHAFTVPSGEVLDFLANITTHEDGKNNGMYLFLYQDGELVA